MSRIIGLRDIHVAPITSDTESVGSTAGATVYGTIIKLERALSAKISPKQNSENFYSDDSFEDSASSFDSIDVEIGLNQLTLESRALLQGIKVINGQIAENTNDNAPYFALGFRALKSNGKYLYVWLLKGKFSIAEDEYATKADKIESKTPTLKGTFSSRLSDGYYRIIADEETASADVIKNWFASVPTIPVASQS